MLERASSDPVLRLEGLRKNFGSLTVTDDVTLDIMPGEMHAIIGPNGAGKTTLINQISGIIPPDGGRIVFGGNDVTALPPDARALSGLARSFQITSNSSRLFGSGKCRAGGAGARRLELPLLRQSRR